MVKPLWIVLGLCMCPITVRADDSLAAIQALVKKANGTFRPDSNTGKYETLGLDDPKTTDADVVAIVDAINKAKLNTTVAIRQVFLGPACTDTAVKKVAEFKGLAFLCVRNSKVTDAGLVALKGLPALTTLRANNTAITDAGLKHLGDVKGLQQLFLDKTAITDAGLKSLQKLRLVTLSVKDTKVTEAGAKSFKGLTVDR